MKKAASLRRLPLLLAAKRLCSPDLPVLRFLSRCPSPNKSSSPAFPFSSSFLRSFSSFAGRRLLHLPPNTLSLHLHAALSSASAPASGLRRRGEDEDEVEEWMIEWEEEDDAEPVIGDGGDGGGVVLGDVRWGERALSLAREVLNHHFAEDLVMYGFKVSPRGYVYVRLDKLTNKYGCPSIEEIENFNSLCKERLDESVEAGEIPIDLALEVSSAGAERLLKVPDDLIRFKEMPMRVQYVEEELESKHCRQKDGIFLIESVDIATRQCVWKLADVKENRAEAGKGRPLNRKQKDWRLQLPLETIKRVTLYLN
ncbi:hypothetical protein Cni_G16664 [Canna indica]|uniref:DUF7912 domain-containing protein n=1 Tax=Canna indica TaxID=4628 RepID=A0AAQ3KFJ0_9LILI|nr:hypothetical protein Cni_G16664 [Canna indica]